MKGFRIITFISALLAFVMMSAGLSQAQAPKRVALLIGNGNYKEVSTLPNPKRDVALIGDVLKNAGFDIVTINTDLDRASMVKAIRAFEDQLNNVDIGVIYYAGHGIEVNGQNFLIPTDAKLASDKDIEDEAVSLDRLIKSLDSASRLRLIILDACRDNPFVPKMTRSTGTRSISRGLAQIEPSNADTLIAFAAKAGTVAQDGAGGNSPYSLAIAKHITTRDLDIRIALGRIRDEVLKATNKTQEPFLYGSLGGDIITLGPQPTQTASMQEIKSTAPGERNGSNNDVAHRHLTPPSAQSLSPDGSHVNISKLNTTNNQIQNKSSPEANVEFWRVRLNVSQGIQNVRSGPGTQHDILFTIPAGLGGIVVQTCKEPEKRGGSSWCLIRWQNKSGWLSQNGLEKDPQKRS